MKSLTSILVVLLCLVAHAFGQIQTGKAVRITIQGVPVEEKGSIDADYLVADNGMINMPHIGQVRAAGLKPEALAAVLQARYKEAEIYNNPTFQVFADVEGMNPNEAMVVLGGQVARPGPVKFQRGLTLWAAIQAAGGPTPFGTLQRVQVTRAGQQRQYDVTQLQFMNIVLEPNDAVNVPQKRPWETR